MSVYFPFITGPAIVNPDRVLIRFDGISFDNVVAPAADLDADETRVVKFITGYNESTCTIVKINSSYPPGP